MIIAIYDISFAHIRHLTQVLHQNLTINSVMGLYSYIVFNFVYYI